MGLFQEAIDAMTWSFSRVKSYFTCPKMFYMTHIDRDTMMDSAFGQWGSLCHELLDRYAKGELLAFELSDEYDRLYPEKMTEWFPDNPRVDLNAQYYDAGKAFFDNFDGFPDNWEIIGSELDMEVTIRGRRVRGFIDLLVRDRTDGKLIVVDHKSKAKFKSQQEREEYGYQLYFYAEGVRQTYGEYPKEMIFNMFRVGKQVAIPFSQEGLERAEEWLENNIRHIYEDDEFPDQIELKYRQAGQEVPDGLTPDFFCRYLCSVRHRCERSGLYIDGGIQ